MATIDNPTPSRQRAMPVPSDLQAPLLRAPEKIRTIFVVTTVAACLPLAAGLLYFGYHALIVSALAIFSCVALEWLYFRVTHSPALFGRTHAYLTGVLLAAWIASIAS